MLERVLSAANLVVTDGNTLLAPEEVEMLSVLRMNRGYMENSRSKYAEEAKQQFKVTVVEEHEQEAEAAPPLQRGRAGCLTSVNSTCLRLFMLVCLCLFTVAALWVVVFMNWDVHERS